MYHISIQETLLLEVMHHTVLDCLPSSSGRWYHLASETTPTDAVLRALEPAVLQHRDAINAPTPET